MNPMAVQYARLNGFAAGYTGYARWAVPFHFPSFVYSQLYTSAVNVAIQGRV